MHTDTDNAPEPSPGKSLIRLWECIDERSSSYPVGDWMLRSAVLVRQRVLRTRLRIDGLTPTERAYLDESWEGV
jgi:hypothetical protein